MIPEKAGPGGKGERVREFYGKFPYPSNRFSSPEELLSHANWLCRAAGLAPDFFPGKKILEVGCGTGELTCSLALHGAQITGLDFSSNSLARAEELKGRFGISGARFICQDLFAFEPPEKFDFVLSLGCLNHVERPEKAFARMAGWVKPGGILALGLYNATARLRHRVRRARIGLWAKTETEKLLLARTLLGKKAEVRTDAFLADKYLVPFENHFSLAQVRGWLCREGFEEEKVHPPLFQPEFLTELSWLWGKKGAFFVVKARKGEQKKNA